MGLCSLGIDSPHGTFFIGSWPTIFLRGALVGSRSTWTGSVLTLQELHRWGTAMAGSGSRSCVGGSMGPAQIALWRGVVWCVGGGGWVGAIVIGFSHIE